MIMNNAVHFFCTQKEVGNETKITIQYQGLKSEQRTINHHCRMLHLPISFTSNRTVGLLARRRDLFFLCTTTRDGGFGGVDGISW